MHISFRKFQKFDCLKKKNRKSEAHRSSTFDNGIGNKMVIQTIFLAHSFKTFQLCGKMEKMSKNQFSLDLDNY